MEKLRFQFHYQYFLTTVFIFLIEVLIATVLNHMFFIRAYLGDVIVVMLIYTFIKSFFKIQHDIKLILGILIFSFTVEFAQYFNIAEKLGFQPGSILYIVVGNSFSWLDMLCYAVGCLLLFVFVKTTGRQNT
ncbi:hypothetical protein QE422_000513 [Chryseobacterium sp. SORGH_AS 447]|uniref:ribosomal maturation YjgA family protein n=1 Tax=Chryseobacterium sp. SORGH_AS_0447 TaxID=3041769 RepID=UPI00278AA79A|nr:DUF2809 domain-containing protein [Chryseobacterium sp. SORGH_AS_0447]MDQ1160145.1 hypothetical protein [Chryseobacterium sp. SORGH_AS_0447]